MNTMPSSKMSKHRGKLPRTKPAEVRRDDLMNAAVSLFLKNGVAHTAIEQISTRTESGQAPVTYVVVEWRPNTPPKG